MKQFKLQRDTEAFSIRHRFRCTTCGVKGPYEPTEALAEKDGKDHRRIPGNEEHIVTIETETKITRLLGE